MKISILIKAYNEEAKIAGAIESSLSEIAGLDGEVVVADSRSKDRTVDIALGYPIRVVQLDKDADRGCGAGAQLAYQHSFGEYVYMLDGDMRLMPGFIDEAMRYLDTHPDVAGVGGVVNSIHSDNMEFKSRTARAHESNELANADDQAKLDGGGLYRRSALDAVGYFADRNLHSFEELDLGARLRAAGGRLTRLDRISVDHFPHEVGSYDLLRRRISSSYSRGAGEVFRAALGLPHFWKIVDQLSILRVIGFLIAWIFLLVLTLAMLSGTMRWILFLVLALLPVAGMTFRRRSPSMGAFAVVSWFVYSAGFLRGVLAARADARLPLPSRILREP